MDLLRYSAVKEQGDVTSCAPTLAPIATAINNQVLPIAQSACWFTWKERITNTPWDTGTWVGISNPPVGVNITPGASNSLCVRESGDWRSGVGCIWTVPVGATVARFQIWGAGGGSGSGCCCGGSHFGGTGAFASVITPVSAGEVYTMCAGCACIHTCCQGTSPHQSGPSWVQGPRLSNFCAEGGCLNHLTWMGCIRPGCSCRFMSNCYATSCGPQSCNSGTDFCFSNNTNDGGTPWGQVSLSNSFFGCATNGAPAQGLNGMMGCFSYSYGGQFCATHPPIYGFSSVSQCNIVNPPNAGTNAGSRCRAPTGFMQYPGAGGTMSHQCGGCNTPNSDSGRFGMVCVTWW